MAQKSSPYAIRVGYNQVWNDYFFPTSRKEQISFLRENKIIRDYLYKFFPDIAQLRIERNQNKIFVYLSIPEINLVLGENQENLKKVVKNINLLINNDKVTLQLNLIEVKKIFTHAQSVANWIVGQLKNRVRSRQIIRNMERKFADEREVKGWKVCINGLIDGSEIAQKKKNTHGQMKLSTIDSNIDEGKAVALMSRGVIGVQVLIYKGKLWQRKNLN